MSPTKKHARSKTDVHYWLERVFHRRFRQDGNDIQMPNYYV
jgi:hypothetical protein